MTEWVVVIVGAGQAGAQVAISLRRLGLAGDACGYPRRRAQRQASLSDNSGSSTERAWMRAPARHEHLPAEIERTLPPLGVRDRAAAA